jgi:toxin ParE1/3/4
VKRVRLARQAQQDLNVILWASEDRFGKTVADRYRRLFAVALRDLRADPARAGVVSRAGIAPNLRFYHLRHSRTRVKGRRLARPRHLLVLKETGDGFLVVRVLHDAMDLERHLEGY